MTTVRTGRRASYREGVGFAALSFGSVAAIALVSSIVTSRIYGVNVIGEYALASAAIVLVRLASSAQERPALVRELAVLEPRDPHVTGLFAATLAFSTTVTAVVGAIATGVVALLFRGPIDQPDLVLPAVVGMAGYLVFTNPGETLNPVMNAFRAGRQLFWVRLHEALVFLVLAIVLGETLGDVWGLVLAMIGASASALVHRVIAVRPFMRLVVAPRFVREGFGKLPEMIRFGLKLAPGALSDGASYEAGTWILGATGTIAVVGAWGRVQMLVKQVLVLNVRVVEMLFPTLVERRAKDDGEGFARVLVDSLRYTLLGLLLPAVVLGGAANGVMQAFGPGFDRGADALTIMLIAAPIAAMAQIQRSSLNAMNRPWTSTAGGVVRLATTIGAGFALISPMGASGAALAFLAGTAADFAFTTAIVHRHLAVGIRTLWPVREWIAVALAFGLGFLAARVTYDALPVELGVVAAAPAGTLAYVAVLVLAGGINKRDRARLRDLRATLARRRQRPAAGPPPSQPLEVSPS